jgi:PDZ-binding kinase
MVRMAQGSGVSVYRMDRSPREGRPRSPWVLKKANVSPLLVRERRRVERTLEHESCMLAAMSHQNIVGFRAAQRASDGHLCLALEHCEISLYQLIQERVKPHGGCVSPTREARAGEVFSAAETAQIAHAIAAGLAYLHGSHRLMHGDVKSANILLARDLSRIKLCDLGVSIPLKHDLSRPLEPGSMYEGTEPWRPPEALRSDGDSEEGDGSDSACAEGMHLCDRTDIFAFGLVLWEMLAGDVPHAAKLAVKGDKKGEAWKSAIGTRPPLPSLPSAYERLERIFRCCTQRLPDRRPSAAELLTWLQPDSTIEPPGDVS